MRKPKGIRITPEEFDEEIFDRSEKLVYQGKLEKALDLLDEGIHEIQDADKRDFTVVLDRIRQYEKMKSVCDSLHNFVGRD